LVRPFGIDNASVRAETLVDALDDLRSFAGFAGSREELLELLPDFLWSLGLADRVLFGRVRFDSGCSISD